MSADSVSSRRPVRPEARAGRRAATRLVSATPEALTSPTMLTMPSAPTTGLAKLPSSARSKTRPASSRIPQMRVGAINSTTMVVVVVDATVNAGPPPGARLVTVLVPRPAVPAISTTCAPPLAQCSASLHKRFADSLLRAVVGDDGGVTSPRSAENDTPTGDELLALYTAVGWTAYTRDPGTLRRAVAQSSFNAAARDDAGLLVGFVRVISDDATIAYIQDILVRPDAQGRGIGRALLEAALARYAHVRQVVLITDDEPRQRAFYEALGFTEGAEVSSGPIRTFVQFC